MSLETVPMDSVPRITAFGKCLTATVTVIPVAVAIWLLCVMSNQNEEGRYLMSVTAAGLLFGGLALIPGLVRAASTRFYDGGVEQFVIASSGIFFSKVRLDWISVETVSFRNLAYTMFGKGVKIHVSLSCFYDYQATAKFIHASLPEDVVRK
ncbi:hypothetical protein [Luteibacter sp. dw_328]|jgi:hypothetical protein|uniref:hypothetical protein n=1 Tax=Luteibacter sp. dw_328 TaxID=2719796 RepID=UPI001BD31B3B|nr:hypothetical protein [Luteibacter sp. dw_328]